ncbi:hypothetical protein FYJ80_00605 [Spirochaetales bacterium NM-380-WT-3C1]|uniref:Uncharacterized protein n=1 Tax=Bullifex porci TaxID=2606638 RepID=A0A7X2TQU5_9SPIO|nr:hypothetical protein [Bullifex porci]MSU05288.1 hypothetical protein [Bullifex porci]
MIKKVLLLLLSILILLTSCSGELNNVSKGENDVNYFIYPYLKFTLSPDRTYYIASVVEGAKLTTVSVPGYVHTDFGAMPIKEFAGFENINDSVNLKELTLDVNVEKIKEGSLAKAENLSIVKTTGDKDGPKWANLPTLMKSGYHFIGWKAGNTFVYNGMPIDPNNKDAVPVWGKLIHHAEVKASCTTNGSIEYWQCDDCNKIFTDSYAQNSVNDVSVPAVGHFYPLVWVEPTEPTCLSQGNIGYFRCDRCGGAFSDENGTQEISDVTIPKVDHHVSDNILHQSETHHWYQCIWCGTEIDKSEHTWKDWVITIHATLHTKGEKYHECSVCNKRITVEIPEHDHIPGVILEKHEATCTEGAYYIERCGNPECGEKVRFEIENEPALGHIGYIVNFKESTCQEEGILQHFHCTRCNLNFENQSSVTPLNSVVIPKKNHVFSTIWSYSETEHYHLCINCNIAKSNVSNHVYDQEVTTTDYLVSSSTCEHANIYKYSCICGKAGNNTFTSGVVGDHEYTKCVSLDYQYHQKACKWCDEILPNSKEKHVFDETKCNKCGYEVINGSGGFTPIITDKRPQAHLTYSKEGTTFNFTLVDDRPTYAIDEVKWYLDDRQQEETEWTFSFTAPHKMTYKVLCVYSNDYGKGSQTIVVNGGI